MSTIGIGCSSSLSLHLVSFKTFKDVKEFRGFSAIVPSFGADIKNGFFSVFSSFFAKRLVDTVLFFSFSKKLVMLAED
jgi:hypothetical protein